MKTTAAIDSLHDAMVKAFSLGGQMTADESEREARRFISAVYGKAAENLGEIVTWYSMDLSKYGRPDFYIEGSNGKFAHVYTVGVTGRTIYTGYFSFNVRTVKSIPAYRRCEPEAISHCLLDRMGNTTKTAETVETPKITETPKTTKSSSKGKTVEQILDSAVASGDVRPEFRADILSGRCTADEAAAWGLIPRWVAARIRRAACTD